jgi:hypothetical protein
MEEFSSTTIEAYSPAKMWKMSRQETISEVDGVGAVMVKIGIMDWYSNRTWKIDSELYLSHDQLRQ